MLPLLFHYDLSIYKYAVIKFKDIHLQGYDNVQPGIWIPKFKGSKQRMCTCFVLRTILKMRAASSLEKILVLYTPPPHRTNSRIPDPCIRLYYHLQQFGNLILHFFIAVQDQK